MATRDDRRADAVQHGLPFAAAPVVAGSAAAVFADAFRPVPALLALLVSAIVFVALARLHGRLDRWRAGTAAAVVAFLVAAAAALGTAAVQAGSVSEGSVWAGFATGSFAAAGAAVTSLSALGRDDRRARWAYVALVFAGMFGFYEAAASTTWWGLLALLAVVAAVGPVRLMLDGALAEGLTRVRTLTGVAVLAASVLLFAGLALA